jgi:hypothetical protein
VPGEIGGIGREETGGAGDDDLPGDRLEVPAEVHRALHDEEPLVLRDDADHPEQVAVEHLGGTEVDLLDRAGAARLWFAHLPGVTEDLRTAARLHGDLLRAIARVDEPAAVAALALNDYLTDLTYAALGRPESRT